LKLLKSAMANAEHNDKADLSTLRVAKVVADAGTTLHRWRPRAYGRAAPIRKRTSHITIVLSDETPEDVHRSQMKGGKKKADKKSAKTSVKTTDKKSAKDPAKTADGEKAVKPAVKKAAKDSTTK